MTLRFDHGEIRHVQLMIHSKKNEPFEIADASYKLIRLGSTEPEDSGLSNIYEHMIDTVISPKEKGAYQLKVEYHIADETLIETVSIQVD